MTVRASVLWKMNIHMAKKWPEKVVQRSFIKEHSFRNSLYLKKLHRQKKLFFLKSHVSCSLHLWALFMREAPYEAKTWNIHTKSIVTISGDTLYVRHLRKSHQTFRLNTTNCIRAQLFFQTKYFQTNLALQHWNLKTACLK